MVQRLASDQLRAFLAEMGLPGDDPTVVTAEHIRHFLQEYKLGDKKPAPATVAQRYRSLRRFFGWLVIQGERPDNPVKAIPSPRIPNRIIPALTVEDVQTLLRSCDIKVKMGVRDHTIIMVLFDTGLRASEFLSMQIDPSSRYDYVRVIGKGNKERVVRRGAGHAVVRPEEEQTGTPRLAPSRA